MRSSRFSAVVFDAGDVLYDATAWRRWLAERLKASGADVSYALLVERWEAQLVDVYTGRAPYWERFRRLVSDFGIPEEEHAAWEAEARAKGKSAQVNQRPFKDVRTTLQGLRARGFRLGVLSDTEQSADQVRQKLERFGLGGLFDAVVTSIDIGHVKPELEAYAAAADSVGVSRSQCAFVAHDVDELVGAQEAGMFAIAFNAAADVPCDVRIDAFSDLIELMGGHPLSA